MAFATTKPRLTDIARQLTAGITSSRFPVGSLLPTELELCERYCTSRHTVRAVLHELPQPMARALKIEAGAAALQIVRRYFDTAGQMFEVSVTVHPAERFSVSMRLQRSET